VFQGAPLRNENTNPECIKVFSNCILDKCLVSRIYKKNSYNSTIKRNFKMGKEFE